MKKYTLLFVAFAFVFGLFFINANSAGAQVATSNCTITTTLRLGSTGSEVSCLQSQLGLTADGKFGSATKAAVMAWQIQNGLTADGVMGAKSRTVFISKKKPPVQKLLPDDCLSGYIFSPTTGESCSVTSTSPVISGVSGPQALKVGEKGTWKVSASNPLGGPLSYSVKWGDEAPLVLPTVSPTQSGSLAQSATFTHNYSKAGIYEPTFYVRDPSCRPADSCQTAETSLSVNVGGVTSTNHAPKITQFPSSQNVDAGKEITYRLIAKDDDNDDLAWGIDWGDGTPSASGVCLVNPPAGSGKNWSIIFSHTWQKAGTYKMSANVYDCKGGGDERSSIITAIGGTSTPSITVLSPNGGTYKVDDNNTTPIIISWSTAGIENITNPIIKLQLLGKNNNLLGSFVQFFAKTNGSSYNWYGGYFDTKLNFVKAPSGTGYMIQAILMDENGNTLYTATGAPFTIVNETNITPSITVLSPNGGESWKKGTEQTIKWTDENQYPSNTCQVMPCPGVYDLYLTDSCAASNSCPTGISEYDINIANNISGWSYKWKVGNSLLSSGDLPNSSYLKFKVCQAGSSTNCDVSDNYFTLSSSTISLPTVITYPISNITTNSATSGGNVASDGGSQVTERGIAYNSYSNVSIKNLHTSDGIGTGGFTSNFTQNLKPNTTYYVRAYAINAKGTAYGETMSFKTLATGSVTPVLNSPTTNQAATETSNVAFQSQTNSTAAQTAPKVSTISPIKATKSSAVVGGNVSADGGSPVTDKGVAYSSAHSPTIKNLHVSAGSGSGAFEVTLLQQLLSGKTYYARAYATNIKGTAYGNEVSFSLLNLPTVTTAELSGITSKAVTSGGTVVSDGGSPITARGFVINSSPRPTLANKYTTAGVGVGTFTSTYNGLRSSVTYYVRAYATNSAGTAYGNEVSFTTPATSTITLPTVTTTDVSNITLTGFKSGGNVTSEGGAPVIAKGIVVASFANPTIANKSTLNGSGSGSFTSTYTNVLTAGVTYYVRAYATNSAGTAYGEQKTFVASDVPPTNCTYSLTSFSNNLSPISAQGGTGATTVWASSPTCTWNASSNTSWVTITSGSSGTGGNTVNYSVSVNSGGERQGTINVAGRTYTVYQTAATTNTTGTISATNCTIVSGEGCYTTLTWNTVNPVDVSKIVSNGVTLTTGNSSTGLTTPFKTRVYYTQPPKTFQLLNNGKVLATATATASCEVGSVPNNFGCFVPDSAASFQPLVNTGSASGALAGSPTSCVITAGSNSCNVSLVWNITTRSVTPGKDGTWMYGSNMSSEYLGVNINTGTQSFAVPYGGRTFTLKIGERISPQVLVDVGTAAVIATCVSGTTWNNSTCASSVLGAQAFQFTQRLAFGSQGNEVVELQLYLTKAGYDIGIADGKFGSKTEAAVLKFQTDKGLLKVDGIVGPEMRALLNQ